LFLNILSSSVVVVVVVVVVIVAVAAVAEFAWGEGASKRRMKRCPYILPPE
jgi:hypothetical protein